MIRLGLLLVLVLAALAACGGDDEGTGTGSGGDAAPGADLEIAVEDARGRREATLECDPDGGTHPNPEEACAALAANVGSLDPVPTDVTCTQQYGGPETARITGTLRGRQVDAELNRTNGCEIARWDHLEVVLDVGAGDAGR